VTYQIVGEDEADLKHGLINISSPIARALIGKEEGDTAEVQAPGGVARDAVVLEAGAPGRRPIGQKALALHEV
jgi:transcription elongation factor GreA